MREEPHRFFAGRRLVVAAARVLADHGGDEVEELPAAQRVMDDVRVVRRPERGCRPAQILRHVGGVEHRAIAHMPGYRRQRIADDLLADHRAAAVRADQCGAAERAVVGLHRDACPFVLEARHPRLGA